MTDGTGGIKVRGLLSLANVTSSDIDACYVNLRDLFFLVTVVVPVI